MSFPIYLANLNCELLQKNHNSLQSKVAERLEKDMENQAKV